MLEITQKDFLAIMTKDEWCFLFVSNPFTCFITVNKRKHVRFLSPRLPCIVSRSKSDYL